jgi:ABC-type antimicrobial peptide transport system permease subunit
VTFRVSPVLNGYSGVQSQQMFSRIERDVGAIPGVRGVAAARVPALAGNNWDNDVSVQGFAKTPDTDVDGYYNAVGPDYFRTMGVMLLSGREFTAADVTGAPRVAIVNEAFAKKFGLGANAVGKLMGEGDSLDRVIVGLVKDAKYSGVKQAMRPVYVLPYKQDTTVGSLVFYVRSAVPPQTLMPEIRAALARIDRTLPITGLMTMPQQIRDNVYLDRMIGTLSAAFAALATLLAAIGLYGVLAYSVVQRTKEIGVRMALGANSSSIVGMVLRHVAVMTIVGAAIGAAGAYGIGRGAQSLLFGINGRRRRCWHSWRWPRDRCRLGVRRRWTLCRRCGTSRMTDGNRARGEAVSFSPSGFTSLIYRYAPLDRVARHSRDDACFAAFRTVS